MRSAKDIVSDYLAIWNERSASARNDLVARTWTEEGTYIDPMMQAAGHRAIDAMVAGAQSQFPGFTFRPLGEPDMHNGRLRFRWAAGPDGAEGLIEGTDFAHVSADGRLADVSGFLDRMPG